MNHIQTLPTVKKGQELELDIITAAFEGKGLGKIGEYAVFVKNTAPGDRVRIRIIKKKKKYAEGILLELISPSPDRITPKCRHASVCGGCTWQHIPYERELVYKSAHVADHFQRIGGFCNVKVDPAIGAPESYYYRNKMEYTFGDRRWLTDSEIQSDDTINDKDFALGLHVPGRYDRILNLDECHLQHPISFRILEAVRSYALEQNLEPYNSHKHTGYLRHLAIRNAVHTNDLMVNLVTRSDQTEIISKLTRYLLDLFPQITTIVNTINDTRSPTSIGRYQNVLYGPGYIRESLGEFQFKIDTGTFFQTNTLQAEALYDIVMKEIGDINTETIYDLYCGVGTLSIFLSQLARKVIGIELNKEAIIKGRENAIANEITNVKFEQGDMKDIFNDAIIDLHGKPDIIITDPPRAGMHDHVIRQIKKLSPAKIIYVSCNSATQARDVALLDDLYELQRIQPIDMFPRTYHIESVSVLKLR